MTASKRRAPYPSSPDDDHRLTAADVAGLQDVPASELCRATSPTPDGRVQLCALRVHTGEHQPYPWTYRDRQHALRR